MADYSLRQFTTLANFQGQYSGGRLLLPALMKSTVARTGALESAVGYTGTSGNLLKQTLANFQTAAPQTNVTLESEYVERTTLELLLGAQFTPSAAGSSSGTASVSTGQATIPLTGKKIGDFSILAGNTLFSIITSGTPSGAQAKVTVDSNTGLISSDTVVVPSTYTSLRYIIGASPVRWNVLKQAVVSGAGTVTDSALSGLSIGQFDVSIRTATGATVTCEKITTGTPNLGQVLVTLTNNVISASTLTFNSAYAGYTVNYTVVDTDTTNVSTIGGPGAPMIEFNSFSFTAIAGVGGGHVKMVAPRVTKSTEFSLSTGEKSTLTVNGLAEVDIANGYNREVAFYWMQDLSGAFI